MSKIVKQCLNCNPFFEILKCANFNEKEIYDEQNTNYNDFWHDFISERNLKTFCKNEEYNEAFDNDICPFCHGKLIDINMTTDEFKILGKASNYNRQLLDAMIKLKQDDIIEYELKMSQFRNQVEQQNTVKQQKKAVEQEKNNTVKCPKCGCTDIGVANRGYSLVWGFIGSGKSMNVCKKCGHKWKP